MVNVINAEKYSELLNFINNKDESANVSAELKERKNHLSHVIISMVSEDGTNYLQGVAEAEIYDTSKGIVAFVDTIYVDINCRETNFGSVLVDQVVQKANECAMQQYNAPLYAAMAITNSDEVNFYTDNGFDITSAGRKTSSGKVTMIRVSKEIK